MRIGVIGAGQLGQMLGFAAAELELDCEFLDPSDSPPAADCGHVIRAPFDSHTALETLAANCDIITYEFENVPVEALTAIDKQVPIYPPPEALKHAQDRLAEKELFESLDIPLPRYAVIDSRDDIDKAIDALGLPIVIKTRRFGYDGKGQFVLREASQADEAWQAVGNSALIAEQWVPFDFEVSVIGVRSKAGEVAVYPLTRNEHRNGILHTSCAPVEAPALSSLGGSYVQSLLEHLDYVGVLALELFVADGRLLANEFAPRVHNSGHWTIEGAETSQFANHLLAICGRQPGSTAVRGHAGMLNLIGEIPPAARRLPQGELHDYGKTARPGRKLGHITVVADTAVERDRLLADIEQSVTQSS
ncbi:MAG: 5-(carboxyamino)imidazole ribonucleotide synthase [Woeseiaceae bacterium]|nr:5-(carboxyamino)imidazole ribonucleotide synthase [Woeseiaceae bacterium]